MSSQVETAIGSDSAYVTIQEAAEQETAELENPSTEQVTDTLGEGVEFEDLSIEDQAKQLVVRVLQDLQRIHMAGDSFVAIVVNPSLIESFSSLFRGLPDTAISPEVRDHLPIIEDETVELVRIITGSELEIQFFQQKYGPREHGGNGLIQDMQAALQRERSPVRLTHDFLRTYYLLELADRIKPKIYAPNGADVLKNIPGLRQR